MDYTKEFFKEKFEKAVKLSDCLIKAMGTDYDKVGTFHLMTLMFSEKGAITFYRRIKDNEYYASLVFVDDPYWVSHIGDIRENVADTLADNAMRLIEEMGGQGYQLEEVHYLGVDLDFLYF